MKLICTAIVALSALTFSAPTDPDYDKQWYHQEINSEDAWKFTTGSKKVIVAIIDNGFDQTHPDIAQNVWRNESEINGVAGVDDDGNGYIDDEFGVDYSRKATNGEGQGLRFAEKQFSETDEICYHATLSAGLIGATHDGVGIAGLNNSVQLMSLKVFQHSGSTPTVSAPVTGGVMAKAVDYAVQNGASIINLSLAANFGSMTSEPGMKEAMNRAAKAGVLFVTASGNSFYDVDSYFTQSGMMCVPMMLDIQDKIDIPPHILGVMLVGRTDIGPFPFGTIATSKAMGIREIPQKGTSQIWKSVKQSDGTFDTTFYSHYITGNYGSQSVDLAAPGGGIYSSTFDGKYGYYTGTSFATPITTGAAALLKSLDPEKMTNEKIRTYILENLTSDPILDTMTSGGGILDIGAAVASAANDLGIVASVASKAVQFSPVTITQTGLNLTFAGLYEKCRVEVFTVSGKKVVQTYLTPFHNSIEIDHAKGVYAVRVTAMNGLIVHTGLVSVMR